EAAPRSSTEAIVAIASWTWLVVFGSSLGLFFVASLTTIEVATDVIFAALAAWAFATFLLVFAAAIGRRRLGGRVWRLAAVCELCVFPPLLAPFLISRRVRDGRWRDLRAFRHRPGQHADPGPRRTRRSLHDESREAALKGVALAPGDSDTHMFAGYASLFTRGEGAAVEHFQEALRLDPT